MELSPTRLNEFWDDVMPETPAEYAETVHGWVDGIRYQLERNRIAYRPMNSACLAAAKNLVNLPLGAVPEDMRLYALHYLYESTSYALSPDESDKITIEATEFMVEFFQQEYGLDICTHDYGEAVLSGRNAAAPNHHEQ